MTPSGRGVPVVTISATYGSAGAVIGPAVAEQLGVPFLDRAIPAAVAHSLSVPLAQVLEHDERRPGVLERVIRAMAIGGTPYGGEVPPTPSDRVSDVFKIETEQAIHEMASSTGGVVLGRAGAIVLAGHPTALHARLHGPRDARIAQAMAGGELDEATAVARLDETDRARKAYVRHFYRVEANDPKLYHLIIDSTAIPVPTCINLIVVAAQARVKSVR